MFALLLALAVWPSYRALKRRERQTAFAQAARKASTMIGYVIRRLLYGVLI